MGLFAVLYDMHHCFLVKPNVLRRNQYWFTIYQWLIILLGIVCFFLFQHSRNHGIKFVMLGIAGLMYSLWQTVSVMHRQQDVDLGASDLQFRLIGFGGWLWVSVFLLFIL